MSALSLFTAMLLLVPGNVDAAPLPSLVDNRTTPYFPPVISQVGESCGSANGVGYIFTYEINAARAAPVADSANRYPYFGTYNFLNGGSEKSGTYRMFIDSWEIIRDNGILNAIDYGPVVAGSTKWPSGYEKYYRGMHNRIATIDSVNLLAPGAIVAMKQWLFDHGNGSPAGGIFTFTASVWGVQDALISIGPEKGRYIVHRFGTNPLNGPHALAIVGYNDSIRYDFNGDDKISNAIDINNDLIINEADQESGAFICANTWGLSSGDNGFIYVPYRLFLESYVKGGPLANTAYRIAVPKEYQPRRTFKTVITHSKRAALALSVGIAADSSAAAPQHIRPLKQFTNAGGDLPMCGEDASPSIELGLDVGDLVDSLPGQPGAAAYFLIVDAGDNTGTCGSLSLIDYSTEPPAAYAAKDLPAKILQGRNIYRIAAPPLHIGHHRKTARPQQLTLPARHGDRSIQLQLSAGADGVRIIDISGKTVAAGSVRHPDGWYMIPGHVRPGCYILEWSDRNGEPRRYRTLLSGW